MNDLVLYEVENHVATVTLNRPETYNALYGEFFAPLRAAFERLNTDTDVHVAILTGAGRGFCSGADLSKLEKHENWPDMPPLEIRAMYGEIHKLFLALQAVAVPVIAAVNGPAAGGGVALAGLCDIRIASETASFSESFLRLAIVPPDGDAWIIPRLIGSQRFAQMLYTAEKMSAAEALKCGLVAQVVPPEALMPTVKDLAARIAVHPGTVLRMAKTLCRDAQKGDLATHLDAAASMMALLHPSDDHRAALARFNSRKRS